MSRTTCTTMSFSAALAVTKGLHFGEALFLLALAGLLRTRKRVFARRAMTLTSATTLGWYAGLVICVLIFFAIGVAQVLGDDSLNRLDPTGGLDWRRSAAPQEICGTAAFRNRVRVVCQLELGLQQVAHGRSIHRSCTSLPLII